MDIYSKEVKAGTLTICTFMFIVALFTKSKRQKQSDCQTIDEWIKNVVQIHNGISFGLKKGDSDTCCISKIPVNIILSKINRTKEQILCDSTYRGYLE